MNFEFFISKRLIKTKNTAPSKRVIRIAVFSVTLSVAVMLVSLSVLTGFKNSVKEKIIGFGSHIQIIPYNISGELSDTPITLDNKTISLLKNNRQIKSVTPVLNKSAVIITDNNFHAVILKGITSSYDTTFFHNALKAGKIPELNKESRQECIISKNIADKMSLSLNDKIKIYFYLEGNYRSKNFYVSGIYDTGLGDYDEHFLLCDAAVLQNLFSLSANDYSSYEISVKDFSHLNAVADEVYNQLPRELTLQTITETEPNLFSWLNLLDSNVIMIIFIMILVTVVTLCSVILIMIFEKKQMIGTLKALGTPDRSIIRIFLYKAGYTTLKGIVLGTVLALILEITQKYTHLIKLDPQSYYLTSVPIEINVLHIILIDVCAFAVCIVCMIIPAKSISKISVVKNLKFE
ncbi:MAG: ABC transporter permease [Bacteroidales bacterium]|nr:ABC transporter permease [Bacteroidales bacterium]